MRIQPQDPTALLAAHALAGADPARGLDEQPANTEQAHSAARRLEGLFATLLVKEMRSPHSSGLFGEGTSADVYGGWFDQYMGEVLAKRGDLHLAQSIERSLASKEVPKP
jgi:Rod binding domain-containing protein